MVILKGVSDEHVRLIRMRKGGHFPNELFSADVFKVLPVLDAFLIICRRIPAHYTFHQVQHKLL